MDRTWLFFLAGLLAGVLLVLVPCLARLKAQEDQQDAAIRELLDCDTTTGWMQGLGPDGGLVWLPLGR